MTIYITGDTHADFRRFGSDFFNDKECFVIVCGDFGAVWNADGVSNSEAYWLKSSRCFSSMAITKTSIC